MNLVRSLFIPVQRVAVVRRAAVGHLKGGVQHVPAEFFPEAIAQSFTCVAITDTVLDDAEKNPCQNCRFVLAIASEDYRDIRGMREVRESSPFPDLPIVMFRRKRERVIDAVGISSNSDHERVRATCLGLVT
ncbi:MAG: hypothetical protein NVSMB22_00400 [Chloroflexota bacterium]